MPDVTAATGYMLYPRGFLGAIQSPQVAAVPRPFSGEIKRLTNNLNILTGPKSGNRLMTNDNVERLYFSLISREKTLENHEFREQVLIVALNAFGTNQFDTWYRQQRRSPSFGEMHQRFLLDTLYFIESGRRDQHLETWNALIGYGDSGEIIKDTTEQEAEFFGISTRGYTRFGRNFDLVEVIQKWVSQPGGYSDLLFTLHILFGAQ